jgi:hypothetical protein
MNIPYSQPYKPPSKLQSVGDLKLTAPQAGDILTSSGSIYSNSVKFSANTSNLFISGKDYQSVNIGSNLPTCIDSTNVNIGTNIGISGYGNYNTVIGHNAGSYNLGSNCVAIGHYSCWSNAVPKNNRTSVGFEAGFSNQGANCVAIGYRAGYLNQHDNTIIINSGDTALNSVQANSLFIKRIRNVNNGRGHNGMLYYNPTTYEVTYSTT